MTIQIAPHLNFRGDARAALSFYQSVLGGNLILRTYAEVGMPATVPGSERIVFGMLLTEDGSSLMGYDVPGASGGSLVGGDGGTRRENGTTITDQSLFLSVGAGTLGEAQATWEGLVVDAEIIEPLAASAWSAGFGMLTDRFGVTWTFTVDA